MTTQPRSLIRTLLILMSAAALTTTALITANAWSQEPQTERPQPGARSLPPAGATRGPMMQRALRSPGREQPHRIEINGIQTADMRVASSVSAVTAVHNVTTPNDPRIHIKLGRTEYKAVKVTGELPPPLEMLDWYKSVRNGNDDRRAGAIILSANDGSEIHRINFYEALPVGLDIELANSRWIMTLAVELIEFHD